VPRSRLAAGDEAVGYDPIGHGEAAAAHLAFLGAYGWPTNPVTEQTAEPDAECRLNPAETAPPRFLTRTCQGFLAHQSGIS